MQLDAINKELVGQIADVVFVHGLDGDPYETWMHSRNLEREMLLYWVANRYPRARVWTLGYEACSTSFFGTSMSIFDRGMAVLKYIYNKGIGKRPIIFITHSLGGLVVKQVLRLSYDRTNNQLHCIAENTKGIAFIATPHTGSGIASFLDNFSAILRLSNTMENLRKGESSLRDLNEWFRNYHGANRFSICSLYETQTIKGILIVDQSSANGASFSAILSPLTQIISQFASHPRFHLLCL